MPTGWMYWQLVELMCDSEPGGSRPVRRGRARRLAAIVAAVPLALAGALFAAPAVADPGVTIVQIPDPELNYLVGQELDLLAWCDRTSPGTLSSSWP